MRWFFDFLKNNSTVRGFLEEYGPQLKKMAVVCLIGLVLFAGFSLVSGGKSNLEVNSADKSISKEDSADPAASEGGQTNIGGTIFVDIGGAVQTPMLAELPEGSRVDDAINAAGGLKKEADMTSINRAEFLVDGQKIFIPSFELDEDGNVIDSSGASSGADSSGSQSGKVNINTADSTQLQTLNGVGPATARKIIDYREKSGRFKSIEDIKNVSGIGDKTFEKLKDHITT